MVTRTSQRPSAGRTTLHIAVILAAAWLVYLNAIGNGFTNWDDPEVVLNHEDIRSLDAEHVGRILTPQEGGTSGIRGVYRPVWTLSYALDYGIGKLNPATYHAHSVLLHSLNAVLVYILALAVGATGWPALAAALIFAVHPIHVEAVAWVSGRNEVLLAFFFLVAFLLAYCRRHLSNGFRPGMYALSLVALTLALLSKVTAAVFPLLLLGTYFWFVNEGGKGPSCGASCRARHVPYFLLGGGIVWIELFMSGAGIVVRPEDAESRFVTLMTMPKVILSYLGSLLLPLGLAPRYDTAYVTGASAGGILAILGLALVILLCVRLARRSSVFGLAALWFALTLLPASNIVLLSTLKADRFLYLPSVGFALAAGALAHHGFGPNRSNRSTGGIVAALFVALTLFYAGLTIRQNRVWKDSVTLWETTASRSPGDYMTHHNLGIAYFESGQREAARRAFERSLALNPRFAKTHNNLGRMLAAAGEAERAEMHFRRAIELDPDYANAHASLGALYAQTERYEEAVGSLARAIGLDPAHAESHLLLGQVYARTGEPERAREEIRRALEIGLPLASRQRAEAMLRSPDPSD